MEHNHDGQLLQVFEEAIKQEVTFDDQRKKSLPLSLGFLPAFNQSARIV